MIDCTRCGKENQEHYKFCLSCGAELTRSKDAGKRLVVPTPPGGVPAVRRSSGPPPAAGQQVKVEVPKAAPLPMTAPPAATGTPSSQPTGLAATAHVASPMESAPSATNGGRWAARSRPPSSGPPHEDATSAAANNNRSAAAVAVQPSASAQSCPNCGSPVPNAFRFCGTCGFTMAQAAPAHAEDAAQKEQAPVVLEAKAIKSVRGEQAQPSTQRGFLVLIQPDGLDGERLPLDDKVTPIGRDAGRLYARDPYLSPRHAELEFRAKQLWLRDVGSLNGVYVRMKANQPVAIEDGSVFRIGQEILRFETLALPKRTADGSEVLGSPNPGYVGRVSALVGRHATGNSYLVPQRGIYLGRERGDILFPEDGYVSGLHCRVYPDRGSVWLMDVGSSNGTFLRIREPIKVESGTLVLMGQHLTRLEY